MIKSVENKGITLIALIITIVLILILAGVTINSLSGSDNVMEGAKKEKDYREGLIYNTERQINQLYDKLQESD